MNGLLIVLAWIGIVCNCLAVLLSPLIINKPREPYAYTNYIVTFAGGVAMVMLCGRVLGWW